MVMVTKILISTAIDLAKSRGGACLSKKFIKSSVKLKWQCDKGHVWEALFQSIKLGGWCAKCHFLKKMDRTDFHALARLRGGEFLSKEYLGSKYAYKWKCKKGHIWKASMNKIKMGQWCRICAMTDKMDHTDFNLLAKTKGGQLLSKEYLGSNIKLKWRCSEGHEWKSTPHSVKQGRWCRTCSHMDKTDFHALARSKGGEFLSEKYLGSQFYHKWRCKKGHIWEALANSVKQGSWCFECNRVERFDTTDFHALAKSRGGEFLSKKYLGSQYQHKWRCKNGHTWNAKTVKIKIGQWCPKCAIVNRMDHTDYHAVAKSHGGELMAGQYQNSLTSYEWRCQIGHVWKARTSWIKSGHWCQQCRRFKKFFASPSPNTTPRGFVLVSKNYIGISKLHQWRCQKGHTWKAKPPSIKRGVGCPECIKQNQYSFFYDLAKSRGGAFLSKSFYGLNKLHSWCCKYGHTWKARPTLVKQRTWCPFCAYNLRRKDSPEVLYDTIVRDLQSKVKGSISREAAKLKSRLKKKGIMLASRP